MQVASHELRKELVAFATNGDWEHAPPHLVSLLKKIGNGVLEIELSAARLNVAPTKDKRNLLP